MVFNFNADAKAEIPQSLKPANIEKKNNWIKYKNYTGQKIWAEVKKFKNNNYYYYSWRGRSVIQSAFNSAMDTCEKGRKNRLYDFTNSEICIVMFVNDKETTDKQKIEYAEEYYGKEIAQKSFALNKDVLKNPRVLLAKNESSQTKGNLVDQLKTLGDLYKSGALSKAEFEKIKKRILEEPKEKKKSTKKKKVAKKSDNDWRKNLQVEGSVSEKNKASSKKKIKTNLNVNDYIFYAFEYPNSGTIASFYNSSTNNLNEAILLLKNGECEFGTSIDKLVENLNYESSFDFKCSYRMGGDNNIYARIQNKVNISIYPKEMKVKPINSIGKTISRVADPNEILSLAKTYKVSKLIKQIGGDKSKTKVAKVEPKEKKKATKKKKQSINKQQGRNTSTKTYVVTGKKEKVKKKKKQKSKVAKLPKTKKIIKKKIKLDKNVQAIKKITAWEKSVLAALDEEKNYQCEEYDAKKINEYLKDAKKKKKVFIFKRLKICIKKSDVLKLGTYKEVKLPKAIINKIPGCSTNHCIRKKAGSQVYKIFVKQSAKAQAKYPGNMIQGMAWFELLYLDKLKKAEKSINRFFKDDYNENDILFNYKTRDQRTLESLIKMNDGRIKMRKALGFSLYENTSEVISQQWLLGEFLNKDKLKITKVTLTPEMEKRKELIERYKSVLAKYKAKLEEEKQNKNKKNDKKS